MKSVQGRGFNPLDRSIDIHVSHLRKEVGLEPNGREWMVRQPARGQHPMDLSLLAL
jgi:hypothetical protein